MIITTIAICGRFCSPEGVINGSCLNYGSFLAGLCPRSRAQRARAPRLPGFILLVGFGGMAYDSYLVAAFAVLGEGGGEGLLVVPVVVGGAISGVGCPARGRLAFRGLCCWWASVAWSVVAVCGSGEGGGIWVDY